MNHKTYFGKSEPLNGYIISKIGLVRLGSGLWGLRLWQLWICWPNYRWQLHKCYKLIYIGPVSIAWDTPTIRRH